MGVPCYAGRVARMTAKTKVTKTVDKQTIEQAARDMAAEIGLINITLADLCKRVGVPEGSFCRIVGASFVDFVEALGRDEPFGGSELVTRTRAHPTLRRDHILAAAVRIAEESGYAHITQADVAEAAGVSPGLVTRYFTMTVLRTRIMSEAVRLEILPIVAQGLADGHPLATTAPTKLKNRAARTLTS